MGNYLKYMGVIIGAVVAAIMVFLTTSCNKWDALETGHAAFGTTLIVVEDRIDRYCGEGRIKEKNCEELKIRLGNIKKLHQNAGEVLSGLKNISSADNDVSTIEYAKLFVSSVEALENLYDLAKLDNIELEK